MREKFETGAEATQEQTANEDEEVVGQPVDSFKQAEEQAVQAVLADPDFEQAVSSVRGIKWARVIYMLKDNLADWIVADRDQIAYRLMLRVLDAIGPEHEAWEAYRDNGSKYIRLLNNSDNH